MAVVVPGSDIQCAAEQINHWVAAPNGAAGVARRNGKCLPEFCSVVGAYGHHAASCRAARIGGVSRREFLVGRHAHVHDTEDFNGRARDHGEGVRGIWLCLPDQAAILRVDG
jgi:hypothetical protein